MMYTIISKFLMIIDKIIEQIWDPLWAKLVAIGLDFGQILVLACFAVFYKYAFRPLTKKVNDIKCHFEEFYNAGLEIQTHLGKSKGGGKLSPMFKLTSKLNWADSNSPFVLNEKGEGLMKASGMDKIVSDNIPALISMLEKLKPETKYDVDMASVKALGDFVHENEEIEKQIKSFIHNNPVYEGNEVNFGDLFFVGSLPLAQEYFKKHPELP